MRICYIADAANIHTQRWVNYFANLIQPRNGKNLLLPCTRQSNTDYEANLRNIVEACLGIGEETVFPLHPRAEKYLRAYGLYHKLQEKVKLTKPLGYLDFLKLMNNAKKILTDCGGIQKEAYILGVTCITLRENTEWLETVEDGWNILVGSVAETIIEAVKHFDPHGKQRNVFGDGNASVRIGEILSRDMG